jgi:phage head maturation protease
MSDEPKVEAPDPPSEPVPAPEPEPQPPETNDADVTVQPAISTEETVESINAIAETYESLTAPSPVGDEVVTLPADVREVQVEQSDIQVRSMSKREIEVRLLPWDTQIETRQGPEEFRRGATLGTAADGVFLMGLDHEAHMGLDQSGQPVLKRRVTGRSVAVWEADDGPHVVYRVGRTQAGDEILALADDKIIRGVSVEFNEVPGGTSIVNRNGRRVRIHNRVALQGASLTYRPAYGEQAAVVAVRSQEQKTEIVPMTETVEAPAAGAFDEDRLNAVITRMEERETSLGTLLDRFAERDRKAIDIPNPSPKPKISKGEWVQTVVRLMTGERIPELQMRDLDDVITTDNAGVVPPAYLTELIGIIDASRPFLSSTRRLETPTSGMKLTVPVIQQRPTAAKQSAEKVEVDSQKTIITAEDFNAITIAGAGDLSIQLIKRSSPSFLNLWMELLGEAYAIESEDQSILSLLNAIGGVGGADPLDPEDLSLGDAYIAAFDAIRRPPDTIWLSTAAVGAFIDAKADTTNQPLYPGLRASATAAGGIEGVVSGLRPVHVPALDAHGAFAVVGPSSGFAWAEDGTYTLQVDVPAKAGRDVALVGILWPCPWYPAAFTAYNVASGA